MRTTDTGFAAAAMLCAALSLPAKAQQAAHTHGHSSVASRNLTLAVLISLALFGNEERPESRPGNLADLRRDNEPAPPDPARRISEQDCTRPIELDGGNLRCK